jgi:hypothetical protein
MSISDAQSAIVGKFTNYRSRNKSQLAGSHSESESAEIEALKVAAAALFDLKTVTKGRTLFMRQQSPDIIRRRDAILEENPALSQIGAFRKASKQLWQEADRVQWEKDALESSDDFIFE